MNYIKSLIPRKVKFALLNFLLFSKDFYRSLTSEVPFFVNPYAKCSNFPNSSSSNKVYDCFYFFNELDTLEVRLNILNDFVDYFVICESTMTFSGKPKPLLYLENIERFSKFHDKIIYSPLDWSPTSRDDVRSLFHKNSSLLEKIVAQRTLMSPNVPQGEENNHWVTEFYQKEALHYTLANLEDEDIVYISDVDEIWNPLLVFEIRSDRIYIFKQKPYIYFLNNRSNEHWHNWNGTVVSRFGNIRNLSINDVRTHCRFRRSVIFDGGWHFSFQGGLPNILEKLDSYGHQELNTPEVKQILESAIINNIDFQGRNIRYKKEEKYLPKYLLDHKADYPKMFL